MTRKNSWFLWQSTIFLPQFFFLFGESFGNLDHTKNWSTQTQVPSHSNTRVPEDASAPLTCLLDDSLKETPSGGSSQAARWVTPGWWSGQVVFGLPRKKTGLAVCRTDAWEGQYSSLISIERRRVNSSYLKAMSGDVSTAPFVDKENSGASVGSARSMYNKSQQLGIENEKYHAKAPLGVHVSHGTNGEAGAAVGANLTRNNTASGSLFSRIFRLKKTALDILMIILFILRDQICRVMVPRFPNLIQRRPKPKCLFFAAVWPP
jgi:hypothetical protein